MRVFIIFTVLLFLSGFQKTKLQSNFEEYGLYKKQSDDEKG
ncbi:hypothetical protein [Alkalihalobacterium chitinilyticum]|uniref:Uncharacterized protein n=1 Tax=Alkalihalobacterium chitinilyticum TaxID=2980103 RepID=A0ABT5VL76_9BACI|nr:hypothetical protein [Alkalihalobacterium chitinilyticum]MDE5416181.1 hypothetical protein [Alkalihalobacterium chitinilyticum]